MKAITLPDGVVRKLEQLSARLGISPAEIIQRGINEYLRESVAQPQNGFESIGFGMWAGRSDKGDSTQWVRSLREQEWSRS